MSVDLPEPDTPVMHTSRRSGNSTSMFLRLCSRTPRSFTLLSAGTMRARGAVSAGSLLAWGAGARGATCLAPDRYWPVSERGFARMASGVSKATISPPVHDLGHALHVARMQADGRLVQHEQRVDQRSAERGSQIDALDFAARERARLAVERQVTQAHFA